MRDRVLVTVACQKDSEYALDALLSESAMPA